MRKIRLVLGLVLLLSVLVSSFGLVGAQEGGKNLVGTFGAGDVPTLDPSKTTDTSSHQIVDSAFVGLTTLNELTLETEPGMATSWDVSEDGLVYTFHLMQDVSWVRWDADAGEVVQVTDESGNVRMVTAHDFVYGIKRTLDPAVGLEYYAYLPAGWIAGGQEFLDGAGSVDDVKVVAVDDYTLEITVTQAAGFVPQILGLWMNVAQPQWAVEEFGDQWIEPGNYHTYGPFALSEWNHDASITIVRNPFWVGTDSVPAPALDSVTFLMLDDAAGFAEWEAGNVHWTNVPLPELDRVRAEYPNELFIGPSQCSYYYGFNVTKEPVDNVHLRRALSYAVDRQSLIDNVLKGGQIPARWFTRESLAAAPTRESHPDLGIGFDPEKAQEELQAYMGEMGFSDVSEIPTINLTMNQVEGHVIIGEAIQQMWRDNLGLDIQLVTQEWAVYLDALSNDPPQIWRLGWCQDYPDTHNFLGDVFSASSANNNTRWSNDEYEAILEEAKAMTDNDARREMYARAEEILVYEDAAIIPIYWYTTVSVTHDNVERTFSQTGIQRLEKWNLN